MNVKRILTVKVSVMDTEPMGELVDIICQWDRDKLPPEYKEQLEAWADKFLKDDDGEESDTEDADNASQALVEQENK
ncbi:hypothetical protein pVco14_078 [Vibrio phage pVco-14]|nr:hypothetical protein pVco14_078 [Vibrio phage pVco-14]